MKVKISQGVHMYNIVYIYANIFITLVNIFMLIICERMRQVKEGLTTKKVL